MAKTNTIIEINGKRYDAVSGKPLTAESTHTQSAKTMDGVVRTTVPVKATPLVAPSQKVKAPLSVSQSMKLMDVQRPKTSHNPAKHTRKPAPQTSRTLMRQSVSKPKTSFKQSVKSHTRTDVLARQPAQIVAPKLSIQNIDSKREAHARRVKQSKFVSRFGVAETPVNATVAPASIPARSTVALATAVAAPTILTQAAPHISHRTTMFDKAILQATSHQQPAVEPQKQTRRTAKKPRRLVSAGATALAVVLIGGFFAYQNIANVTIHLAASKAGFAATLPGYHPSGFSIGKFAYSPGNVTIHFHSNSDASRSFAVIEQPSNWDSATLLDNFVNTAAGSTYQTATAAGRTIYLYGDSNATWVSGGVWYRITNQHSLSTSQIVNLVSSM